LDPKALALPQSIIDLIPPRPNYDYNSELFNRKTGLAFDPLAAESATDILSFLFNTKRLNRLVEYQAENNGLGIDDMIKCLLQNLESKKAEGLEGLQKTK
jgi:hypothetical protein